VGRASGRILDGLLAKSRLSSTDSGAGAQQDTWQIPEGTRPVSQGFEAQKMPHDQSLISTLAGDGKP